MGSAWTFKGRGAVCALALVFLPLFGSNARAQFPAVDLSNNALHFGSHLLGISTSQSVTLTNTGTGVLSISSITITGTDSSDYTQTNTCGSSVAAGASCSITVTFTPQATGTRTASVNIADNAAASPQIVTLVGAGAAQTLTWTPSSLKFGTLLVGTSSNAQLVSLTNSGTTVVQISSLSANGDYAQTNNCGSKLAASQSCSVNIDFQPSAAGSRTGSVVVTDNAAGSPQKVNLSGVGTYVSLTPSALNFPISQPIGTTSQAQQITLTNLGNTSVTISQVRANGDFAETNTCGGSVPAQGSCAINVTFTPQKSGSRLGTVVVTDSDAGSPQSASLTGAGTSVSFSPASLNFGSQPRYAPSTPQTMMVTNSGSKQVNIASILASGDYAVSNNCGSSIVAGAHCLLSVTFTPAGLGIRPGYITLSDDGGGNFQIAALTGSGTGYSSFLVVSPHAASLTSFETVQFTANDSVTWAVDGIAGGNSTVGIISPTGLYTPPSTSGSHLIVATDIADSSQTDAASVTVTNYAGTYAFQIDDGHTGQNPQEIVLTTGNVNQTQFGYLGSYAVDGQVYSQPLYVPGVNIPGYGTRNVVYVATENDSVYAFDADNLSGPPLWQVSFIDPSAGITTVPGKDVQSDSVNPVIGITSTPVIDPSSGTLYVVPYTKENGAYVYRLHALDITSGAEKFGGPTVISASVSGIGQGSVNGTVSFNDKRQGQRPGLLLVNGIVYVAFASGHGDVEPWHGWVLGYDSQTLQQVALFNTTPNGGAGGIWGAGGGIAADNQGNLFLSTGNGDFDAYTGGPDFGDSLLKLTTSGGVLTAADYFTPYNQSVLELGDLDLGSGGVMLFPDQPSSPPHLLIAGGKQGVLYLVNRDNMGQFNSSKDHIVQEIVIGGTNAAIFCVVGFWNGNVYLATANGTLKQFLLFQGKLSTTPVAVANNTTFPYPGATPAISANGTTNGIVWVIQITDSDSHAVLRAYDAALITRELYDSDQAGTRDQLPTGVKFAVPTVANGKVYVGTSSTLSVFGLLPQ